MVRRLYFLLNDRWYGYGRDNKISEEKIGLSFESRWLPIYFWQSQDLWKLHVSIVAIIIRKGINVKKWTEINEKLKQNQDKSSDIEQQPPFGDCK